MAQAFLHVRAAVSLLLATRHRCNAALSARRYLQCFNHLCRCEQCLTGGSDGDRHFSFARDTCSRSSGWTHDSVASTCREVHKQVIMHQAGQWYARVTKRLVAIKQCRRLQQSTRGVIAEVNPCQVTKPTKQRTQGHLQRDAHACIRHIHGAQLLETLVPTMCWVTGSLVQSCGASNLVSRRVAMVFQNSLLALRTVGAHPSVRACDTSLATLLETYVELPNARLANATTSSVMSCLRARNWRLNLARRVRASISNMMHSCAHGDCTCKQRPGKVGVR